MNRETGVLVAIMAAPAAISYALWGAAGAALYLLSFIAGSLIREARS